MQLSTVKAEQLVSVGVSGDSVGTIKPWPASTVPSGYYECDGSTKSRISDSALFAILGTTWGAGDGSTTFNLPDFRGEFLRGWDHGRGVDTGRSLGSAQPDDLKSHNHVHASGSPLHWVSTGGNVGMNSGTSSRSLTPPYYGGTETRPRNKSVMYIIKN